MFSVNGIYRRTIMALRLLVSDALWSKIEPVLRELKHAACIDERTGVSFELSGGERHDATRFEPVWEGGRCRL